MVLNAASSVKLVGFVEIVFLGLFLILFHVHICSFSGVVAILLKESWTLAKLNTNCIFYSTHSSHIHIQSLFNLYYFDVLHSFFCFYNVILSCIYWIFCCFEFQHILSFYSLLNRLAFLKTKKHTPSIEEHIHCFNVVYFCFSCTYSALLSLTILLWFWH